MTDDPNLFNEPADYMTGKAALKPREPTTPAEPTTQPNMPPKADQHALQAEAVERQRKQAEADARLAHSRSVVRAADPVRVAALFEQWQDQECNPNVKRFVKQATSMLCVRWIAERLEASNGR